LLDIDSNSHNPATRVCRHCGSNLFWRELADEAICITAGTLDTPTGIALDQHIFTADKGDYYTLDDDFPKLVES
jgi:hypothetical protein